MKLKLALAVAAFSVSSASWAIPYNFGVTWDGTTSTVNAGTTNPVGINLAAGDTFDFNLLTAPNDNWLVTSGGSLFPFLAFATNSSGTRIADYTLSLFLDGVLQFSTGAVGAGNSFIHIGTNAVNVTTGLAFDQALLHYELLSSDTLDNTISNIAWPNGVPFSFFSGIQYVDRVAVPEPTTLTLLGLGMLALGFARSRKRV